MKKLFILGSFLSIFLFLFGCQSDTSVEAIQEVTSLEKPTLDLQIQTEINNGDFVFNAQWNSIGGAKSYELSYTNPDGDTTLMVEYPANGGVKTYTYYCNSKVDLIGWSDGTYTFTVRAFNGKGDEMAIAEKSVDYPWLGIVTSLNCNFESGPSGININVSWDKFSGASSYHVMLLDFNNNEVIAEYTAGADENSHGFFVSNFSEQNIKVKVDAYNLSEIKIATGTATFTNTAFMGTVTGINCTFEAATNGGINLNVSWDNYPGALYYWVNRLSLTQDDVTLGLSNPEVNYYTFWTPSLDNDLYVKFRVDAYNSDGIKIATGTATFTVPE